MAVDNMMFKYYSSDLAIQFFWHLFLVVCCVPLTLVWYHSHGARHSLEAVDIVSTRVVSGGGVVLEALLHSTEEGLASGVLEVGGGGAEVALEEGAEAGHGSRSHGSAGHFGWVGGCEEHGRVDLEPLEVGVGELADAGGPATLEWVSGDPGGMCVVLEEIVNNGDITYS